MCSASLSLSTVGSQPLQVVAFPDGPRSAHVSWDTPDPIGQTIGYHIYYTSSSSSSGSVAVDGVEYIVGGLANGETYTFSVSGRSRHFESEPSVAINTAVSLGKYVSVRAVCVCVCVSLCVYNVCVYTLSNCLRLDFCVGGYSSRCS